MQRLGAALEHGLPPARISERAAQRASTYTRTVSNSRDPYSSSECVSLCWNRLMVRDVHHLGVVVVAVRNTDMAGERL